MITDALYQVRRTLDEAGFVNATVAVILEPSDVNEVQREAEVASAIITEGLNPELDPNHPEGTRLLGVVGEVWLYVKRVDA